MMTTNLVSIHGCASCEGLHQATVRVFLWPFWSKPDRWSVSGPLSFSCANARCSSYCCMNSPSSPMLKPGVGLSSIPIRSGTGGAAGPGGTSRWRMNRDGAVKPCFPPLDHAIVKALACELVAHTQQPLSRQSLADLTGRAQHALGKPISRSTVGRILAADAIKPWQYKYWIFPRDPLFADKAGRVLDLYAGVWEGQPIGPQDHIISADGKTSIQARIRCHPSLPPAPRRAHRIEYEYARGGALQYLAGWDVRRGYVMGRCEPHTGIEPFGRLVAQVMQQEPYHSGQRVFWVVDNGSSHRGQAACQRLTLAYPNLIVVHTPVHASWLNQIEIYFSIIQRKVLTPNAFTDLAEVEVRLRLYEELANQIPRPFAWQFTREKLTEFLQRLEAHRALLACPSTGSSG
jgi:DDE superfamily endonuclease